MITKTFATVVFLILIATTSQSFAADIYISQSTQGGDTGASCSNSHSATWLNNSGNWANPKQTGKIGPGDIVHLCGTISTQLAAQTSGSNGSPLTILFESGAKISLPVSDTSNGCLNISNRSYITVDGGTNGIIENTTNGTGLATQNSSVGIRAVGCNSVEIKNLTLQNFYVHSGTSDTTALNNDGAIFFQGSNILIHDNVMHDAHWALTNAYGVGDTNVKIYNNNIYNTDHAIAIAGYGAGTSLSGIRIYNNHIHDYANWDTIANAYHHDGIHAYASNGAQADDIWIYNNLFDGDVGSNITAHVFLESATGSAWCGTNASCTWKIFNNVAKATKAINNGILAGGGGTNSYFVNNTIIGGDTSGGVCLGMANTTNVTIANNVASGCAQLTSIYVTTIAPSGFNNNLYSNFGSSSQAWVWHPTPNIYTSNFVTWQAGCGCDSKAFYNSNLLLNSDGTPQVGSPVIGAGINFTSLGITALNSDKNGKLRPSSGAWDVGAYIIKRPSPPLLKLL